MSEESNHQPAKILRLTKEEKNSLAREAMRAAMDVRFDIGIGVEEPVCVYTACERLKIPVRFLDFNLEGIYRSTTPRILLSAFRPLGRRNFNCAHEQGHWYFKHGSTLEDLNQSLRAYADETPEEVLADAFAGHFLMPALGIRRAFARRGVRAYEAAPEQVLAIASEFGVGYGTLVTHLVVSLSDISFDHRLQLLRDREKLKRILASHGVTGPVALIDKEFAAPTLDVEVGHTLVAPLGSLAASGAIQPVGNSTLGALFKVISRGRAELHLPRENWTASIRIAPQNFVGLAKYRYLEDDE